MPQVVGNVAELQAIIRVPTAFAERKSVVPLLDVLMLLAALLGDARLQPRQPLPHLGDPVLKRKRGVLQPLLDRGARLKPREIQDACRITTGCDQTRCPP